MSINKIKIKNAFVAVFDKKVLADLIPVLKHFGVKCVGTAGTVKYLKSKGLTAKSVVSGFDFDARIKSLDKLTFIKILNDRAKKRHQQEMRRLGLKPIDAVIVDLYKPDKKNFPESMDIGGQALIRAAVKNYQSVVVAFDKKSIGDLAWEMKENKRETSLVFRKKQATNALKFIAQRTKLESSINF